MKRMRLVVLLVALNLLLVSCSSISELVRAQVEGLPSWVYTPQQRSGEVSYVGKGVATVTYNARLRAYEDILKQISAFVGEDVQSTYYRELTTTNEIKDFQLTITGEHVLSERGNTEVYLLARMKEDLLQSKRTSVYNEILVRDQEISQLLNEGDRAYRANDDTRAISLYLQAALLASEGPVAERKHELDAVLSKAQTFIEALHFTLRSPNSSRGRVVVYVRRKSRLLSPKVLNAKVLASYQARNSLGNEYTDYLQFNTTNQGFFEFVPYNQGIVKEGSIIFSLDFSSLIQRLEQSIGTERIKPIADAARSIRIEFPYQFTSPIQNQLVVAEIMEFALDGTNLPGSSALLAFESEMASDAVKIVQIDLTSGDLEDQLDEVLRLESQAQLAFLGSVGVVAQDLIAENWIVVANGRLMLYALPSKTLLNDSFDIEAVGKGSSLQEAREQAFKRFGSIAGYIQSAYMFK